MNLFRSGRSMEAESDKLHEERIARLVEESERIRQKADDRQARIAADLARERAREAKMPPWRVVRGNDGWSFQRLMAATTLPHWDLLMPPHVLPAYYKPVLRTRYATFAQAQTALLDFLHGAPATYYDADGNVVPPPDDEAQSPASAADTQTQGEPS